MPTERGVTPCDAALAQAAVRPRCGAGGEHGRAEPVERQRRDEPHAVDFGEGGERDAGTGRFDIEFVTETGAGRFEDQRVLGEPFDGDAGRLGSAGVLGVQRAMRASSNSGSGQQVGSSTGRFTTARSSVPARELGEQRGGAGLDQHHCTLGWASAMASQQAGKPAAGRADHAEAHRARDFVERRGHVGLQRVEFGLDTIRARVDHQLAERRKTARGPIDQRDRQFPFQAGDVGRDVRLDGVEGAGGRRERSVVGHGSEGGELTKIHRF